MAEHSPAQKRVLVDGRVYSSSAFDRGMGRYVTHIIEQLEAAGSLVTVLLYRDCYLKADSPILTRYAVRFANHSPENPGANSDERSTRAHEFTAYLSALLEVEVYDSYIDATPFLGPARFDIFSCPVTAVCYDFIPLRHPDFYLSNEVVRHEYYNGLARLAKADHIICISQTVRDEAGQYLAVGDDRLSVLCPALEERYLSLDRYPASDADENLFTILGFHKSKNPEGSLRVYQQILRSGLVSVRLNAPKQDQLDILRHEKLVPDGAHVTASITDEQKFAYQSGASVIAHLSLEEGFGIPLLEAVFLGKKILALDTPINRELLKAGKLGRESAVFWLPPSNQTLNLPAFERFLKSPVDHKFHDAIRSAYVEHWAASSQLVADALRRAESEYHSWWERVQVKIFSSIPGTSCGVADYSVAYARSATGNVAFFFSEGKQENISHLTNVRVFTHLDFQRFTESKFRKIKGFFNFAFSSALHPGIRLMRTASQPGDVLLIHERRYFDGLRAMQLSIKGIDELLLDIAAAETDEDRTKLAIDCVFNPAFNGRNQLVGAKAPISSRWLGKLPVRAVSHLPPAVVEQMRLLEAARPGSVINDLQAIEQNFDFVPLGIDDRRSPAVNRASRLLRIRRGVQMDDIVIGHYGLILNDLKRLWDVASAVVAAASQRERDALDGRRVFFFLVGKVIDVELFERVKSAFGSAGLTDRLIHSNPSYEDDFDAEITACDAVACFRTQTRGQLSHVFVRALSLGTPVLVNEYSGYGYDYRTTIKEDDVENGLKAAIDLLADRHQLLDMRRQARQHYEVTHRGDESLTEILRDR
jgi:glycosyltransferase involved in cell wall biosynthesis